jgi:aryl-alcohol dehydrogenase-like predicted oxidoreductase
LLDALRGEARQRGVAMGSLALAWVLSNPAVTAALIGPRRVDHFEPWLDAVDIHLSASQREALLHRITAAAA